ncbi:hypothetical protein FRC03_010054 [Tulasnella sp. 419]|nr:hypothetical protein FRC02_006413 [Tulasnella sp. 418]KAG8957523.1 hypothetical protein FRC03_010054 [Tulasnella sp. 419]
MPLPPPPTQSAYSASVFRNNLNGEDAYARHQRYVSSARLYGEGKSEVSSSRRTEFEALKEAHQFLRDDEEDLDALPWEQQLAVKYYNELFKEYAICDLKHYKSGNVALRWRTEDEVVSGVGQFTCANPRCAYHPTSVLEDDSHPMPTLTTLELPFAYEEHGEKKVALVKTVLCPRCKRKLTWKRDKEKAAAREMESDDRETDEKPQTRRLEEPNSRSRDRHQDKHSHKKAGNIREDTHRSGSHSRHGRDRRSASPRHRRRRSASQ